MVVRFNRRIALAVLLPGLFLTALRVSGLRGTENSFDAYYHIRMADLGPGFYTASEFPGMALSVWREHFSDKELLFHLILTAVRRTGSWFGLSASAPFHLPALLFAWLVVVSFVYTAVRLGGRSRLWLFAGLLAGVSPFFTHRILLLRPHSLSIALMLLACALLNEIRTPRALWRPVLLGFLFAWAHSNPHFVLLPAAVFGLLRAGKRPLLGVLLPVACLAGILLGYTLHPQFPNTFLIWKIQCVDVLLQSLGGSAPVALGDELSPPSLLWWLKNSAVVVLAVLNLAAFETLRRRRRLTSPLVAVQALSLVFLLGAVLGQRAMEYACPYTILSLCLNLNALSRLHPFRDRAASRPAVWFCPVLLGLCLALAGGYRYRALRSVRIDPFTDFGAWVRAAGLPPGTDVVNLVWHEFPLLFYAAPHLRYSFGLDPMFAYAYRPEVYEELSAFRTGTRSLPPRRLAKLTGARFLFLSTASRRLAEALFKQDFACVYQGRDGWLFDLLRP